MPTIDDFEKSLTDPAPAAGSSPALQALWWAGKDDWDAAHEIAAAHQDDRACNLVHAHLHRREGDADNALEWYAAAGEPPSDRPIDEEWRTIADRLLADAPTTAIGPTKR